MAKAGVSPTTSNVVNERITTRRLAQDIDALIEAALAGLPDDLDGWLGWPATPVPNII